MGQRASRVRPNRGLLDLLDLMVLLDQLEQQAVLECVAP
jgi:hypothetical protein